MKKEYTTPTMKAIHLDLQQIVCGSGDDTSSIPQGHTDDTSAPTATKSIFNGNEYTGIFGD